MRTDKGSPASDAIPTAARTACTAADLTALDPRFDDDPSGRKDAYEVAFNFTTARPCNIVAYPSFRFLKSGHVLAFTAAPIDPSDTADTALTTGTSYQINIDVTGGFVGDGNDICKTPVTADTIMIAFGPAAGVKLVRNTGSDSSGGPLKAGLVFCADSMVAQREIG